MGPPVDLTDPPSDRRPRLLFLSQSLPYPLDNGAAIRTYHVLRMLSRAFDVTACCFYRPRRQDGSGPGNALERLGRFARIEAFPIPQEESRGRYLYDHARSLLTRTGFTFYTYQSDDFERRLEQLLAARSFDLVHVDSLYLFRHLPAVVDIPTVVVHHNVESALLRRRAERETSPLRRAYVRLQAELMEKEEARWCSRVALNVTVSDGDRDHLLALTPGIPVTVVPNGVDVDHFRPARAGSPGAGVVSFVGEARWFPNQDALDFFSSEILPWVQKRCPDVAVRWIGRVGDDVRERFADVSGLDLTGWVEDVRPHLLGSDCFVVPLRVGGGTRLKILTAWALGLPVVSTSVGCEGLEAVDGGNILVRDDPRAFADAVAEVLADRELRVRLGRSGRETVERAYSWDRIGEEMIVRYRGLVAG